MPTGMAPQNEKVKEIRNILLNELDTTKIFVSWKDKEAKLVHMIIEGDATIDRETFDDLVQDKLPHDLFDYKNYPSNKLVDWAETHILFHV